MKQIFTILWDSYRLLTAKKLFWIVLAFSALIAITYASIGFTPKGISFLFGAFHFDNDIIVKDSLLAEHLYMQIFTDMITPWWLGLFAMVLALISVCPIFPDFLKSGSIDIAVSKPINRWTLFFVKYLGSLLFVAIQVFLFCVIIFLAQGWRIHSWNLEIFWAVPLITFVFSLIYCVAVLTAMWTNSTLFSLLVALLMWGVTLGGQWSESFLYKLTYSAPAQGIKVDMNQAPNDIHESNEVLPPNAGLKKAYNIVKMAGLPLPKTREITYMLKQKITVRGKKMTQISAFLDEGASQYEQREAKVMEAYENRHSATYIIGTSLAYECVILGIAGFIFVRRDF